MNSQAFTRRSFLTGVVLAGAAAWAHDSSHISARVLRGLVTDSTREVITPPRPAWEQWDDNRLSVAWIGHATVLINFYGFNILTDPVLFDWIGASIGIATIGRRRVIAPALTSEDLPRIDLVLLSHAHMDHMDMPTLRSLPSEAQVVTAKKTADLVRAGGFKQVRELSWGEQAIVTTAASGDLGIQAFEVKHSGARWTNDSYRGYNGYRLTRNGQTLIFGGDTALSDSFKDLNCSKPALASIMPIGSYGSRSGNHCTPEEAVAMLDASGAEFIIPVHHNTFPIGKEPLPEPLERLEGAITGSRIAIRQVGESWTCPV